MPDSDPPPSGKTVSDQASGDSGPGREQRLARALRDNLARRKAQARARADADAADTDGDSG
ncbi:hypothetical protein [Roseospirillum parvum]|uniref:Uncharacterized protein n=1 Tax=Roseospirillum parvum TaxID=83401 RepID=A0A1G8D667_9PROT|nr:hypothetical protein [Roseospirillum parvum]SDH52869.1 hypothetical protein SAMN05421742_107185 [Roseospirillum parvum]